MSIAYMFGDRTEGQCGGNTGSGEKRPEMSQESRGNPSQTGCENQVKDSDLYPNSSVMLWKDGEQKSDMIRLHWGKKKIIPLQEGEEIAKSKCIRDIS